MIVVRFSHISEGAQDRIIRHIFAQQRARRTGKPLPEARHDSRRTDRRAWP